MATSRDESPGAEGPESGAGNDLPDAWLACAVVQQAAHLVSFDRDKLLTRSPFTLLKT